MTVKEFMDSDQKNNKPVSRRDFVGVLSTSVAATALPFTTEASPAEAATGPRATVPCTLIINKESHVLSIEPRVTLLDLLREHLQMPGAKKGCDHGQCGACTVLVNGRRINSCLTLAVMHDGDSITTIEGLEQNGQLHPLQAAFIEHDGFQCGYCTPGQICSALAVLDEIEQNQPSAVTPDMSGTNPLTVTDDEIRERMSGNICRCGAYAGIVAAVRSVHQGLSQGDRA